MAKRVLYLILKDYADEIGDEVVAGYTRPDEEAQHDVDLVRHQENSSVAGNDHYSQDEVARPLLVDHEAAAGELLLAGEVDNVEHEGHIRHDLEVLLDEHSPVEVF